jgi:malate dehydrogenase (oxaloacetate-decarboxylating)
MVRDGLSEDEARRRVWLIDKQGLITDDMHDLPTYQQPYARPAGEVAHWERKEGHIDLLTVVQRVRPTVLIGTSTAHGAFTEPVVRALCDGVERPILLPLSNPTERIEVMPQDAIEWSEGKALVAAGIPTDPFDYDGPTYTIGQANNALLYPGLGLGAIVSGATHITDGMLLAAAEAVAGQVDPTALGSSLLPPVQNLRASSAVAAFAVVQAAARDGVATVAYSNDADLTQMIQDAMWQPAYPDGEV